MAQVELIIAKYPAHKLVQLLKKKYGEAPKTQRKKWKIGGGKKGAKSNKIPKAKANLGLATVDQLKAVRPHPSPPATPTPTPARAAAHVHAPLTRAARGAASAACARECTRASLLLGVQVRVLSSAVGL